MKAQFKYAFLAGLYIRGPVFAVIFLMNTVFIILGSLGLLPYAAHITAVSLCGVSIAVMTGANIAGDVFIARRMFGVPGVYLDMLTPVPRWKIMLASLITMLVMDLITMIYIITAQVWLSFNMIGGGIHEFFWETIRAHSGQYSFVLLSALLMIAAYLLAITVILFCAAMKKSAFFKMPASGLLTVLLAFGCFYICTLLHLLLAPLSVINRYGLILVLTFVSEIALPLLILLTVLQAAVFFVITSKLLERRINL